MRGCAASFPNSLILSDQSFIIVGSIPLDAKSSISFFNVLPCALFSLNTI